MPPNASAYSHNPMMKNTENELRYRGGPKSDVLVEELRSLRSYVHPPVPNPAPLGLIGFGFTTCLLQVKTTQLGGGSDTDAEGVDTVVLGFALFFGGLLQVIAGLSEIRRNNLFGYTAFLIYGGFWMSIATIDIVKYISTAPAPAVSDEAIQTVLALLAIVTAMLWTLTFKLNMTLCSLFFLLTTTCALLSAGVNNEAVDKAGGWFGIATSANAFWLAFAELINDVYGGGTEIIPLGHFKINLFKKSGGVHAPGRVHGHRPEQVLQEPRQSDAEKTADEEQALPKDRDEEFYTVNI
mgnify:CR=1 FL=1